MNTKKSLLVVLMVSTLLVYSISGIILFLPVIDLYTLRETAFHSLVIAVTLIIAYVFSYFLSTSGVSQFLSIIDRKLKFNSEKDEKSESLKGSRNSFRTKSILKLILALITELFLLESTIFVFTFFHELHHASSTILLGGNVIELKVVSLRNGNTLSSFSNLVASSFLLIAGSLGNIIIYFLFLVKLIKNRFIMKIELFFTLYFIFCYNLLDEIVYCLLGFLFLGGDAGLLLQINPIFNREICLFISIILYAVCLVLLLKHGIGESYWKKIARKVKNFMNPHYSPKN